MCCRRSLASWHAELVAHRNAAAASNARLIAAEAALERRTAAWVAAEAAKQALMQAAAMRAQQAAGHAAERIKLQVICCGIRCSRPLTHNADGYLLQARVAERA